MYKSLCTDGLGSLDPPKRTDRIRPDLWLQGNRNRHGRHGWTRREKWGDEFATQFVNAANVDISTFELPIDFGANEDEYKTQVGKLDKICELATSIGAKHCYIRIASTHPAFAIPGETLKKHRSRIHEIADKLAAIGTKIGLQFVAGGSVGEDMRFIHQPDEILALVKTIGHDNIGFVLDTWNWQSCRRNAVGDQGTGPDQGIRSSFG